MLRAVLVCAGTLTALVGAVMCFAQRHLRRMLAFATISHVGLFLIGIGMLEPGGLGGVAVYVLADGAVKASLFVCVGVLGHRFASVDEHTLRGRGRDLPLTAGLMALGGLALASLPPFGPFLGKSLIEASAKELGYGWVAIVFVVASATTGGAVLRACGRILWGGGVEVDHGPDPFAAPKGEADPEVEYPRERVPLTMTIPTVTLLAVGLGLGLVPGLTRGRVRDALGGGLAAVFDRALWGLRELHSGHVGDYVAWLVVGTVVLGGIFAATL